MTHTKEKPYQNDPFDNLEDDKHNVNIMHTQLKMVCAYAYAVSYWRRNEEKTINQTKLRTFG